MTQLVKYEAARQALSEAKAIDEVKDIRDKAEAMRLYAKQAKDFDMANWAAEIRIRAERKLGEMLKAQRESGGMAKPTGSNQYQDRSHDETDPPRLVDMGITKSMSSRAQAIAAVPEEDFERAIADHKEQQKELTSATIHSLTERGKAHVANNSGENEWYTPEQFIISARIVMGSIDLDPASSELANKTVQAKTFFTSNDDGLSKRWYGSVWMNPPYAQPLISQFSKKISEAFNSGDIEQAIVLVNNATDTSWFQNMAYLSSALCFPKSRIKFIDKNGNPGAPLQGQAILYMGKNGNDFASEFQQYGFVLTHV